MAPEAETGHTPGVNKVAPDTVENMQYLAGGIAALHRHCVKESFRGYSLYDSHNSFIPFGKLGTRASFLVNQLVKRSPVNLRKLLGIRKGINPKGVGLFLHAYSLLHKRNALQRSVTSQMIHEKFTWLKNNYSRGYSGYCWGYNYDWPRSDGSMFYAFTPNVVVTAFICRGLYQFYHTAGEALVKEIVRSASKFIKNDVYCSVTEKGRCYSYTPLQRDLVINANLLAAEILAYEDALAKSRNNLLLVEEVLNFTLEHQNTDGSWFYSISPDTGKPKKQIDFHQGYVLDSMDILTKIYGLQGEKYEEAIAKGLKYYREQQFNPQGYSYWRVPKIWPVDIHNQSQGIITMCRFSDLDETCLEFAVRICKWTIDNMRSPSGRFYYQKYPLLTNRTDYLRWNQAWMFLAMSILYRRLGESIEDTY